MWACINGVLQGKSHVQTNTPCQDKIAFRRNTDLISIALADGAGSCVYSDIGAEIAVETTCKYLFKEFDRLINLEALQIAKELIHRIRTRLGIRAKRDSCTIGDYSSTLLFCAIHKDKALVGHLGDGVIGVIGNDVMKVISFPENGEFANTTYFTTSTSYQKHFRIQKICNADSYDGFVLMSDGSSECLYDKKQKKLATAVLKISSWIETNSEQEVNEALMHNMQELFFQKTNDDCSVIIAQRINK